nr:immunoglobulin heavy chain junction region [Mus musculus]
YIFLCKTVLRYPGLL